LPLPAAAGQQEQPRPAGGRGQGAQAPPRRERGAALTRARQNLQRFKDSLAASLDAAAALSDSMEGASRARARAR